MSEPRARTARIPFFPGPHGAGGYWHSRETSVVLAVYCTPSPSIEMVAAPGTALDGARTTAHSGDAAITRTGSPLIRTRFASGSAPRPAAQIENGSRSETNGATVAGWLWSTGRATSTSEATDAPDPFAMM